MATINQIGRSEPGTMYDQNANNVAITGGSITNLTSLGIFDTNTTHSLLFACGSNLTANRTLTLTTGDNARTLDISAANVTISTFGASVIDDATAGDARTTLGAQQTLSGLALTAVTVATTDKVIIQDVSDADNIKTVTAQSIADLATPAGGTAPANATYITQTSNGTLSAEQALDALATGLLKNTTGTGVLSIAVAGTDYLAPAAIGVTVQAFDATLASLAALGTAADRIAYTTGIDTWAETTLTTLARGLLDDATQAAMCTTILSGAVLTAVTVASGDKVVIQDVSDSDNVKTVTAQAIADLAAGGTSSPKVWLNMNGAGTTVNDSFNVTSVADTGTGRITITIGTDFANATYVCVATLASNGGGAAVLIAAVKDATIAVGSIEVDSFNTGGSVADPVEGYHIAMFGDQ